MDLSTSTVMITGASRGLGRALAVEFARAGAKVSACARNGDALRDLSIELDRSGRDYLVQAVDVTDSSQVEGWLERTRAELGVPTVLINNASLLGPREPLLQIAAEEWNEVLRTNLYGTFVVIRTVAPTMVAAGSGSIINLSSGASLPPRVNWGPYSVSKAAVDALSLNLAAELEGTGVRVNIVDPGAMRTSMRAEAYPEEDPETLKEARSIVPLFLRLTEPDSGTGHRISADEWLRTRGVSRSGRAW